MEHSFQVTNVKLSTAPPALVAQGLLGWVALTIDETLRLDGIALRRTAAGRLALSFPARTDASGKKHPIVRPVDDAAREALESMVFAALGLTEARQ